MTDQAFHIEALNRRRYNIVKMLGQSPLARVYLLREGEAFGFLVAKEICPPVEADEEFQRLFLQESSRLRELNHPGLPRIVDAFVEGRLCYLIREFTEGNTPESLLYASKKPLSEKQIFGWIQSLCEIFLHLHRQQPPFLFGGLRPDNILISPMGKIKITDYGLARFMPEALQKKYFTSMAAGYTSPELRRGQPMDIRSDIYSLGMLAYHLLTGVKADVSLPKEETLRTKRAALPDRAVSAVMRAVDLKPENRFQSVEEMKNEIVDAMGLRHEPIISVDRDSFDFPELAKGSCCNGDFTVKNVGTGNLNAIIESDQEWLKTSPEVHFGNVFRVHFTILFDRFQAGRTYTGQIRVFSENPRTEKTVTVTASKKAGLFDKFRRQDPQDVDF